MCNKFFSLRSLFSNYYFILRTFCQIFVHYSDETGRILAKLSLNGLLILSTLNKRTAGRRDCLQSFQPNFCFYGLIIAQIFDDWFLFCRFLQIFSFFYHSVKFVLSSVLPLLFFKQKNASQFFYSKKKKN